MKNIYYLFFVLSPWILSCADEPSAELKVNDQVDFLKVFDVGNAINSSDLGVNLQLSSVEGIDEIRFFIMKETEAIELTTTMLENLAADQFFSITSSEEFLYSVQLPDNQIDLSGEPIQNGISYFVQAYFPESKSISNRSSAVQLADIGILNGLYAGELSFLGSGGLMEVLIEGKPGSSVYKGEARFPELAAAVAGSPNPFDSRVYANIAFTIENDQIKDFNITYTSDFLENMNVVFACRDFSKVHDGNGEVKNFSIMNLTINGEVCGGVNTIGTIVFVRV